MLTSAEGQSTMSPSFMNEIRSILCNVEVFHDCYHRMHPFSLDAGSMDGAEELSEPTNNTFILVPW
jgi:hypothetical protein